MCFQEFTVNNQPFLINARFPTLPNGKTDFTYMSLDCFHLSQKGYARSNLFHKMSLVVDDSFFFAASNALWNNMLEPEGQKSTNWTKEFTNFMCPTEDRPFIATKRNSFNLSNPKISKIRRG